MANMQWSGLKQNNESTELEEDGIKVSTNIIDTPGFGDNLNNDEKWVFFDFYILTNMCLQFW